MRHRVKSPPRGKGKPRSPYRRSIGKRESPSPQERTAKRANTKSLLKENNLENEHDIVCGVCILNFKDYLDRKHPFLQKVLSVEVCACLFKTAVHFTKACPLYNLKSNREVLERARTKNKFQNSLKLVEPNKPSSSCSTSSKELPVLDNLPLEEYLKDTSKD